MARFAVNFRFVCASLAAASLVIAPRVFADEPREPSSVIARPSACRVIPWSRDAWIDLLRVELAADAIRVASSSSPSNAASSDVAPVVTIDPATCEGTADHATLVFRSGDVQSSRVVALSDVPVDARPRVLAIAMAQLVREGMAHEETPPDLPAPTKRETSLAIDVHVHVEPLPITPAPPPSRPSAFFVFAAGEARTFASASTGLFGARAGIHVALAPSLALDLDGGVLVGTKNDPLGQIDETLPSAGATFLATGGDSRIAFGVGPRIEAGYAIFRGRSSAASITDSTARAPVLFFALTAEMTARIASSFHAFVALDAGTTLLSYGARADDREVAAFDGPLLSLRLGFAWSPGDRDASPLR